MLKIEFDTDNEAFEDLGITEISEILDTIKEQVSVEYGSLGIGEGQGGRIYDSNDTVIGQWNITREV